MSYHILGSMCAGVIKMMHGPINIRFKIGLLKNTASLLVESYEGFFLFFGFFVVFCVCFFLIFETYNRWILHFYEQFHLVADCPLCPLCMWSTSRLGRSLAVFNTMNDVLEIAQRVFILAQLSACRLFVSI